MLSADAIVKLHDETTKAWHALPESAEDSVPSDSWLARVARQHRANFDLWHIEDEARTPGATDAQLADVKRRIDRTNQLRNDLAEDLDRTLLDWLAPQRLPAEDAPLHSESPGLIIDRLSILALKLYHTREEAERSDCAPGHADRNLRAPRHPYRAARRSCPLPRSHVAGDAGRHAALQALPAAQDVQRPHAQPRNLSQFTIGAAVADRL